MSYLTLAKFFALTLIVLVISSSFLGVRFPSFVWFPVGVATGFIALDWT